MELDVAVDILLGEGVFVPVEVEVFDGSAYSEGVFVAVGPHGVEHELHVVSDGAGDGLADLDVVCGVSVRVNLVGGPAHLLESEGLLDVLLFCLPVGGAGVDGDGIPACAEQPVDGLTGELAVDVPEADVDGGDDVGGYGAVHLVHVGPDGADVERVSAHDDGLDELDETEGEVVGAHPGGAEEGVAGDALVGLDGDDSELLGGAELRPDAGHPGFGVPVEHVEF